MRQSAEARSINADIKAVGESQLKNHLEELDVILIGPQVRYLQNKIKAQAESRGKVAVIDSVAYGMVKGDKVLDQAIALTK